MNGSLACSIPKILIVEDNKDLRALLKLELSDLPICTQVVEDGVEALRVLLQGLKVPQAYPIVILDCAMPFADGFTVVRTIRCLEANRVLPFRTKIGMYTGYAYLLRPSTLVEDSDIDGFVLKASKNSVVDMVKGFVGELELRRESDSTQ